MNIEISSIKKQIEELMKLQEHGKPGYACGWNDACGLILAMIEKEELKKNEKNVS